MWHDWVFTIGGLVFILALLPSVFGPNENKPSWITSLGTMIVLIVFAYTYFDLNLETSGWTTLVTAGFWYSLFADKAWDAIQRRMGI